MKNHHRKSADLVLSVPRTFSLLVALAVLASLLIWLRMASPHAKLGHLSLYAIVIVSEWLLLGIAFWRSDNALSAYLGSAYLGSPLRKSRSFLWDLLTAALVIGTLLAISPGLISLLGQTGWISTQGMLPRGSLEVAVWVAMAVSAGVCEEVVFRGYLQQQIAAWTGTSSLGVLGQALLFGLCHAYQGWKNCLLIAAWGCVFGVAALWRKTLGGNMIAHAVLDIFSAF